MVKKIFGPEIQGLFSLAKMLKKFGTRNKQVDVLCCIFILSTVSDSKHYSTHPYCTGTGQALKTDILLTEIQRPRQDHLSTFLMFFSLPLGIRPNDRGPPFEVVIRATMYQPVPGIKPRSPVFLGESVAH